MKKIEIEYTRKVTYNVTVEVEDDVAERLLLLDGEDGSALDSGFEEIVSLCGAGDEIYEHDEIEDLQVSEDLDEDEDEED